jgi:glutamate-1-semialdehyde 2,1-aminomutase
MAIFDARRAGAVSHGGTFNGNPVAAAAGLATLRELTPAAYERLAALGRRLTERLSGRIEADGLDARVVNVASLFQVFRGEAGVAFAPGAGQPSELYLRLLLNGIAIAPRGMGAIPTVATEQDVDDLVDAIARALRAMERSGVAAPVAVG